MDETDRRPDIFWIVCDEFRCDGIHAYGNPWMRSPVLDGLAAKGVMFTEAYCQTPACVASRASFLSGRYSHSVGNLWYDRTRDDVVFFPEHMHAAGYRTVTIGKEDHHRARSAFAEKPFRHDEGSGAMAEGTVYELAPAYRSQEASLGVLHRYTTPHKPLIVAGTNPLPPERAETAVVVSHSLEYLERYDFSAPLLLRVSGIFPHTPVLPPKPHASMYNPADMVFRSDGRVPVGRPEFETRALAHYGTVREMSKHDVGRMRAAYYGLCSYIDNQLGRLFEYLEHRWPRPYILLFHSDHGTQLGEHELHEKFSMYRNAVRVPLIFFGEGIPKGVRISKPVELVDIAPTILGLAKASPVGGMQLQGRDLVPLMLNPNMEWKTAVFTESNFMGVGADARTVPALRDFVMTKIDGTWSDDFPRLIQMAENMRLDVASLEGATGPLSFRRPRFVAIRTARHVMTVRAVWCEGQGDDPMGALYDLASDPDEMVNVFGDPAYREIRDGLYAETTAWDRRTGNPGSSM